MDKHKKQNKNAKKLQMLVKKESKQNETIETSFFPIFQTLKYYLHVSFCTAFFGCS